jgi:hypothetical protein
MEPFEIKDLYALNGQPGLYRFVGQAKSGYVFSRLTDPGKIVLQESGISRLNDVRIYTAAGEVTVESVIDRMYEIADSGVHMPSNLSSIDNGRWDSINDFMEEMVPRYDREQFKPYHMEKLIKWYHEVAAAVNMLDVEPDIEDEDESHDAAK